MTTPSPANTKTEQAKQKHLALCQNVALLREQVIWLKQQLAKTKEAVSEAKLKEVIGGAISKAMKEMEGQSPGVESQQVLKKGNTSGFNHPAEMLEDPTAKELMER